MFNKNDKTKERLEKLDEQIDRLEQERAIAWPGSEEYKILTEQLDLLYQEKEKHLTPWYQRPDGKAMIFGNFFSGLVAVGLATYEHWFPLVGKIPNHVIGNFFRNNNRRV